MAEVRDRDSAEQVFRLRVFAWTIPGGVILGAAVAILLRETRGLSGAGMAGVILLGLVAGAAAGGAALWASNRASAGLVQMLLGAGNLAPAPSFSLQESLVARGRYQEAVDGFRAHLAQHPDDDDARLALAPVLAGPLGSPAAAAAVLLEIRRPGISPALEWRVSQDLIDLYRRSNDRGRLMAELARLGQRHPGTPAGRSALAELAEYKRAIVRD